MEIGSILQFLENKTILITGATGFVAKVLLEKILRIQPNVKKLYLLLRAADAKSASQRFQNEIIGKDLFRVLKEKMGENLQSFIAEKVIVIPGDICYEDLGVTDAYIQPMLGQVDVIVNVAATTNFHERYDIALSINTLGAIHVLNFAKKCARLKVLVHVSTAYVSGEREGLILESPYHMGEALNGTSGLSIEEEKKVIEERLLELRSQGCTEKAISRAMKDLGVQRAKLFGWPNSYVFTKAMAEMVIGHLKGNLSVVIIRPTIVTSTLKEPFPGWIEGVRTVDSLSIGYAQGKLTFFLGDDKGVVDLIPADMVVNSILVAMAAHANQPSETIYHVGSSVRNPVRFTKLHECAFHYFTKNPWIDKDGKAIKVGKVRVMTDMTAFRRYMTIRYVIPLKILEFANSALCKYFEQTCSDLSRKVNLVMRLVEIYRPYLFFKGVFDDINTEKLRLAAKECGIETEHFYFDPSCIDWEDYVANVHIPGTVKYVFK